MGPPGREVQLVRTLLPQLQQDFINIQTEQKAYCDFAKLAQVREAIDDLQNDLEQHDLDDVVHTVQRRLPLKVTLKLSVLIKSNRPP
jgi:hypothetical protein